MNRYPSEEDIRIGKKLIAEGKVGLIVLAGGDGTRLGWNGPKGTFPILGEKTLFDLLVEKIDSHQKVAVMTSPLNHDKIREVLPESFELFNQNMLPLLDEQKQPLQELRPNGNGEVLKCFYESGLYEKWKKERIEYVQIILIDNPLAKPFDPNQIGVHAKNNAEVSLKAVPKKSPDEKVGVIGIKERKVCVIEYTENPPKDWTLANTSLFCFSMDFIEKVHSVSLPIHLVRKEIDVKPVYRQETFIFDLLPYAERVEIIVCKREETFAPIKEPGDVEIARRVLLHQKIRQ